MVRKPKGSKVMKVFLVLIFITSLLLYIGQPSRQSLDDLIKDRSLNQNTNPQDGTEVMYDEMGSASETSSNSQ